MRDFHFYQSDIFYLLLLLLHKYDFCVLFEEPALGPRPHIFLEKNFHWKLGMYTVDQYFLVPVLIFYFFLLFLNDFLSFFDMDGFWSST